MVDEVEKPDVEATPAAPIVKSAPAELPEEEAYWVPSEDPDPTPMYKPEEAVDPEAPAAEPEPEPAPEPAKPDEPAKPVHAPEVLDQAYNLGMSTADIEEMTPTELARTVRHMMRFGTAVHDGLTKKKEPEKEAPEPKKVATYDVDANPAAYPPEILETIRAAQEARELRDEIKKLKEEQAQTAKRIQQQHQEQIRVRLNTIMDSISPEITKQFDVRTAPGREQYDEFLETMSGLAQAEQSRGKMRDEPARVRRALEIMGIDTTVKAKEDAKKGEIDEKKDKWKANALSNGTGRKGAKDPLDLIREIKAKHAAAPTRKPERTNWLPDE